MIGGLSGGQKATPSWNLQNNLASGGGQGSKPQVLNAFGQGGVAGGGGGFGGQSGGNQTVQGSTNGFGSGNSGANSFGNTFGNGAQANDQNYGSFAQKQGLGLQQQPQAQATQGFGLQQQPAKDFDGKFLFNPQQQPQQQFAAQPQQQFAAQPQQQFAAQPPQQFAAQPPQQFAAQPPQQFAAQPPQQFAAQPPQQFAAQPPQQFAAQPPQQFAGPDHRFSLPPMQNVNGQLMSDDQGFICQNQPSNLPPFQPDPTRG
jgi:hypothetical protein